MAEGGGEAVYVYMFVSGRHFRVSVTCVDQHNPSLLVKCIDLLTEMRYVHASKCKCISVEQV